VTETIRTFAGDCTVTFAGTRERTVRGYVVCIVKPDRTVLVHDAGGYQPVAWLTRADSVSIETEGDSFSLTARTEEQTLRVVSHAPTGRREFPASEAGVPVGDCPECGDSLVRTGGDVVCLGCDVRFGLPGGVTVLDDACEECGLPTMRVDRGERFDLCIDWRCESLTEAITDALDRRWDCPDCGADLRVIDRSGRAFLGCDAYPDCETTFSIPAGVAVDECTCGLPVFETAAGRRCLDGTCEAFVADESGDDDGTGADSYRGP
jgi:DNA topoisomerase-1